MKAGAFLLFLVYIVVAIALSACGGGSDQGGNHRTGSSPLGRVELGDARMFVVLSDNSAQGSALDSQVFSQQEMIYKITHDDRLMELIYYDTNEEVIDPGLIEPVMLMDLNRDFIYLEYVYFDNKFRHFVRKSDGMAFEAPASAWRYTNHRDFEYYYSLNSSGTVADGNVYYMPEKRACPDCFTLHKIDFSEPAFLTDTQVSPNSDKLLSVGDSPLVDIDGNSMYFAETVDRTVRFIKNNGAVENIIDLIPKRDYGGVCVSGCTFLGANGRMYYYYSEKLGDGYDDVVTHILEIGSDEERNIYTRIFGTIYPATRPLALNSNYYNLMNYFLRLPGKVFCVTLNSSRNFMGVTEVYNSTGTLSQLDVPMDFSKVFDAQAGTNNYIFIFGKESGNNYVINCLNTVTRKVNVLVFDPGYEVYGMKVSSDSKVYFYATRNSDGADLMGTIDQMSNITILLETVGHSSIDLVSLM